jgi:hypothetical protein
MPFDATHLVFAHAAALAADARLLRPELLAGAVAPDCIDLRRFLPTARTHLAIGRSARHLRRIDFERNPGAKAFAFGYFSHVWLDRLVSRWRLPVEAGGRRMSLREFYAEIAQRDAEEALRLWGSLTPAGAPLDARTCRFVNPLSLATYCAGVERRLLATPLLEDDTEAAAIFASERLQAAAREAFASAVSRMSRT